VLFHYNIQELPDKWVTYKYSEIFVIFNSHLAFGALTLLVGRQEEHLACKN